MSDRAFGWGHVLRGYRRSWQQYMATAHGHHDVHDYARAAVIIAATVLALAVLLVLSGL